MNPTLRVALHGFSDFEQRALGSFFRLSAPPALALELVPDIASAQLIVADADRPGTIEALLVSARVVDTVFIGARAPTGAAARLSRPIDALHVLREIEALALQRRRSADPTGPPGAGASACAAHASGAGFAGLDAAPATPVAATRRRAPSFSALLVDDSAIAQRYLQLRLQRLGMDCDLAPGSARALELLSQRAYGFVFIDVELGEGSALDGLALCQHIRHQHHHVGGHAPVLVLVSAHHSELDRARGAFAGCDHYLAKPPEDEALHRLLSQHRAVPPARP